MKLFPFFIILLLSACTDLSNVEKSLVGYWKWELIEGDFKESGFLDLRKDRTLAYKINHKNLTETLSEERSHSSMNYWRVNDGFLCIANEWEGGSLFNEVKVKKETCRWSINHDAKNNLYLEIDGGFINSKIMVTKSIVK